MSRVTRVSLCLALSCVALMLIFSNSAVPQEIKKDDLAITELRATRLQVLRDAVDSCNKLYQNARREEDDIRLSLAQYFDAALENATTREQRVELCETFVALIGKNLEFARARVAAARGSTLQVLLDEAYLIESQIKLENVKSAK